MGIHCRPRLCGVASRKARAGSNHALHAPRRSRTFWRQRAPAQRFPCAGLVPWLAPRHVFGKSDAAPKRRGQQPRRGCWRIGINTSRFELSARAGLAAKFLSGSGIEIGALQRALPVPSACIVRYIDRMPFCDLVTHYPELASVPVQQPDLIDDGELLLHIADAQDFVIANHFFEHCKNPIHTLLNFARVLAPGGVLFMAVPDKRYTKDVLRLCTPYRDLLEAFRTGRREGLGVLHQEWAEHWENASGEAIFARAKELEASGYSIHYNVWALSGLLEFLISAKRDVQLPFEIASVVSAENEVIVILTRIG